MARNVLGGRSKAVIGLKELKDKLNDLTALEDFSKSRQVQVQVHKVLGSAAAIGRDAIKSKARSMRWPSHVIENAFSFSDPDKSKRGKPAALFGVNKQRSLVEWRAGKNPKSPRAKASPGTKISESLATMYEIGTSRMAARPAVRPAVKESSGAMRSEAISGLKSIIDEIAKK